MKRRQFLFSLAAAASAMMPRPAAAGIILEPPATALLPALPRQGEQARRLTFHHAHTGERMTVDWVAGKAVAQAEALDWFMRDWREKQPHAFDPRLLDIAWDVTRSVHYDGVLQVLCGYRTPKTNTMLIRTGHGAVDHSTHLDGKALDFTLPGRDLGPVFSAACALGRGGVGGYGGGGWFVHIDTGRVRKWMGSPGGRFLLPQSPYSLFPRSPFGLRPLSIQFGRRGTRPSAEALRARVQLIRALEQRMKAGR